MLIQRFLLIFINSWEIKFVFKKKSEIEILKLKRERCKTVTATDSNSKSSVKIEPFSVRMISLDLVLFCDY